MLYLNERKELRSISRKNNPQTTAKSKKGLTHKVKKQYQIYTFLF